MLLRVGGGVLHMLSRDKPLAFQIYLIANNTHLILIKFDKCRNINGRSLSLRFMFVLKERQIPLSLSVGCRADNPCFFQIFEYNNFGARQIRKPGFRELGTYTASRVEHYEQTKLISVHCQRRLTMAAKKDFYRVAAAMIIALLCSLATGPTASAQSSPGEASDTFTHTIFAEYATTTWCGFCKYAHAALKNIYANGLYPFYYVILVRDVNTHAADRIVDDLNLYGYPTVFFDGGYTVEVGSGSVPAADSKYVASIDSCGNRPVADIDVGLEVAWQGNATMKIQVLVQNNEASDYDGHIRVYVTEIASSMGWDDTWDYPYTFTFLDYAFNEDIYINAGESWQQSTIWNGNEHTDGHGNDFGSITEGNTMVIAAVFNAEWHQGYAYPADSSRPFDAYYVDEAAAGLWVNSPPYAPSAPTIEDESTCVDIEADLGWTGGDPNVADTLTYDVYLGKTTPPPQVASNHSGTSYDPGKMTGDTVYYWRIVTWDNHESSTAGPVWSFTTRPESMLGDCNHDQEITLSDAVYLINYMFRDGPLPEPPGSGNVNCDEEIGLADIVYLINYLLKSGSPPPCYCY